jgi:hypothetical protein
MASRPPLLPYLIPWETLNHTLRRVLGDKHWLSRWTFGMWARVSSDEWPSKGPWWSGYMFSRGDPGWLPKWPVDREEPTDGEGSRE